MFKNRSTYLFRYFIGIVILLVSSCGSDVDFPEEEGKSNEKESSTSYIDRILSPYNLKVEEYKLNIDINKNKYILDVSKEDSVTTVPEISYEIISKYAEDADSITDEQWNKIQNTRKGYSGAARYSETQNTYGYNTDKKQSIDFDELSHNILKPDYLEFLIEESNLKDKSNEIQLEIKEEQEYIQQYSDNYKKLSNSFEQNEVELNDIYDEAVKISIKNKDAIEKQVLEIRNKKLDELRSKYEKELNDMNEFLSYNKLTIGMLGRTVTFYLTCSFTDRREQGAKDYQREVDELNERMDSILKGQRLSNSKLDLDIDIGYWPKMSMEERKKRKDKIYGTGSWSIGQCSILGEIEGRIRERHEGGKGKLGRILDDLANPNRSEKSKKSMQVAQEYIEGRFTLEDTLAYFMSNY